MEAIVEIPKIIEEEASKCGFNHIEFIKEYDGAKLYGASLLDENGLPVPMGLPTLFLLKGGNVSIRDGEEALALL